MFPHVNELQDQVQKVIDDLVASGREDRVQVAAYLHGSLVVDARAGVGPDALFFSYSTGKGLTATVAHVLAEQGLIDYDLRIADVWPEFAQHGKGGTTLRHALTHTAGVPVLPADITPADFADWDRMCAVIAASEPVWPAGTQQGYHAWTFGWLVGETVRRATGRTLSQVLAEDIAAPLGVERELFLGVPEAELDRVVALKDGNWNAALAPMCEELPHFDLVAPPAVRPSAELANRRDFLMADVPAGGTMSARAVARMYAALIGEVDGVRLVSPERLRLMTAIATEGPDWTFEGDGPKTLGYAPENGMFGWSGSGGSLAGAAPELGLAVAVTKNLMSVSEDDPMEGIRTLLREAVA